MVNRDTFFKISDEVAYYIELQVKLGPEEGVNIPCRADFIFRKARDKDKTKPLVVFTDGFHYHRDRIGKDMAQRMAIVRSGRYHVWSLTWKDVENCYHSQNNFFRDYVDPTNAPNGGNLNKLLDGFKVKEFRMAHQDNSFDWLIRFLQNPDGNQWKLYSLVHGLTHLDANNFDTSEKVDKWKEKLKKDLPEEMTDVIDDVGTPCIHGLFEPKDSPLRMYVIMEQSAINKKDMDGICVACCLYDKIDNRERKNFEAVWNGFLRLYNLFQFIPKSFFVTHESVFGQDYTKLNVKKVIPKSIPADKTVTDDWDEAKELCETEIHTLLDQLAKNGWSVPEIGYELVNDQNEIVASSELGWADKKIAFLREDELDYATAFEKSGWKVFPINEVLANPESYIDLSISLEVMD